MKIIADKYEVEKELGKGGFGAVYLVRHLQLDLKYALKVILNQKSEEEEFTLRFKREAMVLTKLIHPNTVALRDFGRTADGDFYMAMDFCPGQSLRDILYKEECLSPFQTLSFAGQILSVMGQAHEIGIIHRDLKPDNIMIVPTEGNQPDQVKVLDFGIARLVQEIVPGAGVSEVTKDGAVIGTPMYMSPEQIMGDPLDQRSDIYSLGMVLYQCISGGSPYPANLSPVQLMMMLSRVPSFSLRPLFAPIGAHVPGKTHLQGHRQRSQPALCQCRRVLPGLPAGLPESIPGRRGHSRRLSPSSSPGRAPSSRSRGDPNHRGNHGKSRSSGTGNDPNPKENSGWEKATVIGESEEASRSRQEVGHPYRDDVGSRRSRAAFGDLPHCV